MNVKGPITTHILDVSRGRPAVGVAVRLEFFTPAGQWEACGTGETDADGRVTHLLDQESLSVGTYRLVFATGPYFAALGVATFYPEITVDFVVASTSEHYHVPLLLSPYGYSTYRGS